MPGAADNHGSVSVSYQGAAQQFFRPILGGSSSQTVVGQAKAAWGAAGGAGGVLPAALSMGKLSTCKIPGTGKGTECWFYVDNSALGNATWALMNVQPSCTDTKYGWNVRRAACQSKAVVGTVFQMSTRWFPRSATISMPFAITAAVGALSVEAVGADNRWLA